MKDHIDDATSPSEVLNWFWAIDAYGTPDFSYFAYSGDAASKGLSQPLCAAFTSSQGQTTFVAWNPHKEALSVNWWKVGQNAGSTAGALSQDLVVPPGWYATASTSPPANASLLVTIDAPASIRPGSTVTFNVTVRATGPGQVSGVAVSGYLPYSMTYVSSTPAGTVSGNSVRWDAGILSPGETRSYLVTGKIPDTANGQYTAVAEASGQAAGNIAVKGNRILLISVQGGPSLDGSISANKATVMRGEEITFTFVIRNDGTQDLEGAYARMSFQPVGGLSFISANYAPQYTAPDTAIWDPPHLPDTGALRLGTNITITTTYKVTSSAKDPLTTTAYGQANYAGGQAKNTATLTTGVTA
jgi:uncharacterized repeat protein (TIGR01451 family)